MTETPEAKAPQTPPGRPGWQLSDEARQEEELYDRRADARDEYESEQFGWALFAVVTLILVGGFQIINGLIAFFRSGTYQVGRSGLPVNVDYTAWGWTHLLLGILLIAAGYAVFSGKVWGRTLGVIAALLSAIVNFAFIPAYPVWSLIIITVDVLVIYALIAHGGELRENRY